MRTIISTLLISLPFFLFAQTNNLRDKGLTNEGQGKVVRKAYPAISSTENGVTTKIDQNNLDTSLYYDKDAINLEMSSKAQIEVLKETPIVANKKVLYTRMQVVRVNTNRIVKK